MQSTCHKIKNPNKNGENDILKKIEIQVSNSSFGVVIKTSKQPSIGRIISIGIKIITIHLFLMNGLFLSIIVSILSLGAKSGDEKTNNAPVINRAINECAQAGGGVVIVPKGEFTTGSIYLKSGVKLRLERGAVLKGSKHLSDYTPLQTTVDLSKYESGQGSVNHNSATDSQWSLAMIFGIEIKNSGIEGEGIIDGNNIRNSRGEEGMRGPHTVLLASCKDCKFDGFELRNSANYAFLGYQLTNSSFTHLQIRGGWDGIHIRGAQDVKIERCQFYTGDDAIAGGYWSNMKIRDCMINSSCNGIRMIMPSVGLDVAHCTFYGPGKYEHITSHRTNSEAAINLEPGAWGKAPGRMDDIHVHHCRISRVLTPFCVTLGEDNTCGRIVLNDIVAKDITRMALSVKSWGKAPTNQVVMRHCDMEFDGIDDANLPAWFENRPTSEWPVFPSWGMYFRNVEEVDAKDVTLRVKGKDYRKAYICEKVGKENLSQGVKLHSTYYNRRGVCQR